MTAILQRWRTNKDGETWVCPGCTTVNNDHNVNCTVCLSAKPGEKLDLRREQESVLTRGKVERSFGEKFLSLFSRSPLDWRCPVCTKKNGGYYTMCTACGFWKLDEKSKADKPEEHGILGSITSWFKRRTSQEDFGKQGAAENSQSSLWVCQECTFAGNPDKVNKCTVCDTKRPKVSVDGGHEHPANISEEDWQTQLNTQELDSDDCCPSAHSHTSDSGISSPRATTPHHTSTSPDYLNDDSYEHCNSPFPVPSENTNSSKSRNYATGHRQKLSPPNGSRSKPTPGSSIQDDISQSDSSDPNSSAAVHNCGVHVTPSVGPDPSSVFLGAAGGQETWRCSVCGAFNRTLSDLPRCYICGIGEAPQTVCPTVHLAPPPSSGSIDQHQGGCGGEYADVRHLELTPQPIQTQAYEHEKQHRYQMQSQCQQHQDQHHHHQYQQDKYHRNQYQQDQYQQDKYHRNQYQQDQYQQDKYHRNQYQQDQYQQDKYQQDKYQQDQYQQDQYQQDQYQQDKYHRNQYQQDQAQYQGQGQYHQLANPSIHGKVNTLPPIQENLQQQYPQQNQQHKRQQQQQQHKQSQPPQHSSRALEPPKYAHRQLLHNSKASSMTFEDSMCRSTSKGNCTQLVSVLRHKDEEKARKVYEGIKKYCRKVRVINMQFSGHPCWSWS